ncbi:MAG: diguanylate cyclase [Thermodesulfovibrionales bacterium]|nr:diguanylate cyclase [Thermodesulfovibrionales bacterium]
MTDRLTELYNRIKIKKSLIEEIEKAKRYKNIFSVIIFDLDLFKKVNVISDRVYAIKYLLNLTISYQKGLNIQIFVYGEEGAEFIIVCPNTDLKNSYILAEDLRKIIENYRLNTVGHITTSF